MSIYRKVGKGTVFLKGREGTVSKESEGMVQYLKKGREGYIIYEREGRVQYL